jgi:hypothetical protein
VAGKCGGHTVDRNGHDFRQNEAIGADERRDTVERVQLEVLGVVRGWHRRDQLDVEVVGFREDQADGRAGIALGFQSVVAPVSRAVSRLSSGCDQAPFTVPEVAAIESGVRP